MAFKYRGNIDIYNRPVVRNKNGSISTVRSITVGLDDKFYVLPTVSENGKIMSTDEAVMAFKKNKKHLGIFDNEVEANEYANQLHEQQAELYGDENLHPLNAQGLIMDGGQAAMLDLSAWGDFLNAGNDIAQGIVNRNSFNFEAGQAAINSEILKKNAQAILDASNDYVNQERERGLKVRGQQRTAMGASGFDVNSTSYNAVINQTDYTIARNTAVIRRNAMEKYANTLFESRKEAAQAKMYKKAGKNSLFQGIIRGVADGASGMMKKRMIDKYYKKSHNIINVTDTAKSGGNVRITDGLYGE